MSFLSAPLWIACFGELVGTLLLVLLGNGVGFSVNHRKMFANQSGKWIAIVLGWASAVFIGVFSALAIGAPGHLNPAVTIYASFKNYEVLAFIPMQFIGAALAQIILYTINWNFIKDEALSLDGNKSVTRSSTCTNPAYDGKKAYLPNFLYELVATSVLILMLFLMGSKWVVPSSITSFEILTIVSISIVAIGMSLGSATGFAINPARDLSPRLMYQLLLFTKTGKNLVSANWQYSWIPVFGPILSGIIFGAASLGL